MKHRFLLDFKSINFKLWAYFALFAVLLMIVLWFLQVFFLSTYYQEMKIAETKDMAAVIKKEYRKSEEPEFINKLLELSAANDLYIHIETPLRTIYQTSQGRLKFPLTLDEIPYADEMGKVKYELMKSKNPSVSIIIPEENSERNVLAYASYLEKSPDNQVIMYIFSPLYPVSSTVSILRTQLFYVMVISMVLAFALSYYLAGRIAKPIRNITKSAKQLAEGNYGITFEGGSYTEIINLANTLTYTSARLEKADTLQKDLMANVSHDLRTPLTMVKSYAEMVRDLSGDNPEKRNAHLQVIIEEADRLNGLVSDMLTLSRVQSGALALEKSQFNIKETAESLVQSYSIFCEQEGYMILLNCSGSINVIADEAKIKQVLSNLLNNAIKYCGQDKLVLLSIFRKAGKVRCEVTDHGMGIAPEELEHIWERYYKASTHHVRSTAGTGLGLAIVKEILQLHNAKFGVISNPGKGSTFWFEL